MRREYYSDSIGSFRKALPNEILGILTKNSDFPVEQPQRDAWLEQIRILKEILAQHSGAIYLEYAIPRMGKRIDVVLLIGPVIFVLEFKVGEDQFTGHAVDQVWDYALDLKNFHDASHAHFVAPVLIATNSTGIQPLIIATSKDDKVITPIRICTAQLPAALKAVLSFADGSAIDRGTWEDGRYCPTPTIIEAAMALYAGHSVADISRNDADAINLKDTSTAIAKIIVDSKTHSKKSICFVTGVPGAGKTLVGLNVATQHVDKKNDLHSVFLSGNGPLVEVLREALARDKVTNERKFGRRVTKTSVLSEVKAFIQNVHNFRDDCLIDERPPIEHVALFDEAQRAWNVEKTADFMRRKKGKPDFNQSEPEFLISCLNRHSDWAVVVCLVGGGQEIHSGEAGITEWIQSLERAYRNWDIYISPRLSDSEYGAEGVLTKLKNRRNVSYDESLHLAVSMRSFRAENVSLLVKQLLDFQPDAARETLKKLCDKYPIVVTRDLHQAKKWVRQQARGSERYGLVASAQAYRLKPHAIDVRAPVEPINWFLGPKEDTRSSYFLEDAATEFQVQGLELDWACVTWDGDFRFSQSGWEHREFRGDRWTHIKKPERQLYLKNAYRVLLTRARQGMVIFVPHGDPTDQTRKPEFYDPTFEYLKEIGFSVLE